MRRERSSMRCSMSGAFDASISSWLMRNALPRARRSWCAPHRPRRRRDDGAARQAHSPAQQARSPGWSPGGTSVSGAGSAVHGGVGGQVHAAPEDRPSRTPALRFHGVLLKARHRRSWRRIGTTSAPSAGAPRMLFCNAALDRGSRFLVRVRGRDHIGGRVLERALEFVAGGRQRIVVDHVPRPFAGSCPSAS